MRNLAIFLILICTVAFISFFAFKEKQKITNFPPKQGPIVAFGDSLIEGVGASAGVDLASILSQKIGEPIINLGVAGENSREGLARIDEVLALKPKIVLVLFGGNDFMQQIPKHETFPNIDEIVTKIQDSGAIVILLGIRGGLITDNYEKNFEKIAEARGALYVSDVLRGLFGNKEYMDDPVHPNNLGYRKIAERVYPVLKIALNK